MIPARFPRGLAGPAFLLAESLLVAFPHGAFSALTEAQARGKRIYAEGKGRVPIFAFLMPPGIKAPGAAILRVDTWNRRLVPADEDPLSIPAPLLHLWREDSTKIGGQIRAPGVRARTPGKGN